MKNATKKCKPKGVLYYLFMRVLRLEKICETPNSSSFEILRNADFLATTAEQLISLHMNLVYFSV